MEIAFRTLKHPEIWPQNLSARGKPSTMVSARTACRDGFCWHNLINRVKRWFKLSFYQFFVYFFLQIITLVVWNFYVFIKFLPFYCFCCFFYLFNTMFHFDYCVQQQFNKRNPNFIIIIINLNKNTYFLNICFANFQNFHVFCTHDPNLALVQTLSNKFSRISYFQNLKLHNLTWDWTKGNWNLMVRSWEILILRYCSHI